MTEYTKAMKVTQAEIVDTLNLNYESHSFPQYLRELVDKIEEHGIAVDYVPIPKNEMEKIIKERRTGFAWEHPHQKLAEAVEQAVLARLGVAPTLDQARAICEQAGFSVVQVDDKCELLKDIDFLLSQPMNAECCNAAFPVKSLTRTLKDMRDYLT